jgi:iron complex outermembrane receptor protein
VCSAFAQVASQPEPQEIVVVVTGTYAPVPLQDIDRNVNVIDTSRTAILFGSIYDVLENDSSVDLRRRGPNGIQGDLSIRGGSFAQSLVLLNGIRLNDAQSAHHDLDLPIPLEALSEVEILHGSGSTQYGSDAVTGVVNLLTRPEKPEISLRAGIGNFGTNEQSGSIAEGTRRFSEQLVFSRDFSTGFMPDRDYRDLSLASISHISTALGATDILLATSDRPFGADQFYGDFDSWERTRGWFASLRQELGADTEVDFAYRRHTDLFVLYRDQPQIFTNRHTVESWEGDLRRKNDLPAGGQLHYGIETYADSIVSDNLGSHSRMREAGYIDYEARWRKRYTFSAGLRDEIYGSFNNEFSPTVSAGAWLSEKWKLRGSASRAFRVPSYTDLYYHDPANLGSPDLRPEKAWTYEAGVDWRPARAVRAEATVFERRDRDLIDYVRDSADAIYRATNIQNLNFTGFEGSVTVRAAAAQEITAQYTELDGSRAPAPGTVSKYAFDYLVDSGIVSWQGSISQLIGRTRIGVARRYGGAGPYAVWDASLARGVGRIRPYVRLTNLTDTVYEEIPGVAMPKRAIVGGIELRP